LPPTQPSGRRERNEPKSAQESRRPSVLKDVVKRVVVRHPWVDLILGSELLSGRYGRRLVSLLRRNPQLELRFRGSLRISEFSLRCNGWSLYEVLRRNLPRELRFKRNGVEISVPWEVGVGYAFSEFESLTGRWLTDHLRPGSVVIDVGAHVGYFTVLMAKIVGRAGRVYAVEPAEENLHFLRKNVEQNRVHNVTILPLAAGRQSRVRNFRLMDRSDLHGFYKHPSLGNLKEIVQVRESPLDELVGGPVDVVKVDVEGAELEVLEGMRGILGSNPKSPSSWNGTQNASWQRDTLQMRFLPTFARMGLRRSLSIICQVKSAALRKLSNSLNQIRWTPGGTGI
jgi:FkbM family methyltransferase